MPTAMLSLRLARQTQIALCKLIINHKAMPMPNGSYATAMLRKSQLIISNFILITVRTNSNFGFDFLSGMIKVDHTRS